MRFLYLSNDDATKLAIMHAVDKPISKISVTEICEHAGISRQLFYKHFKSKYDIGLWFAFFADENTLCKVGKTLDWEE